MRCFGVNRLRPPPVGAPLPALVRLLVALAWFPAGFAPAAPYTPATDDEILERLPAGIRSGEQRRQRQELAEDPGNLRDSLDLARSYLDSARAEGDPRFVDFARAILGPWWDQSAPPVAVLVLRAGVRSASLEFDRSLADLALALTREPTNAAAAFARFEVLLARGDVGGARQALPGLTNALAPLARATATLRVARFGVAAADAEARLVRVLDDESSAPAGQRAAAACLLGEVAAQFGRTEEALARLESVRASGSRDVTVLAAIADVLLDRGEFERAEALLAGESNLDALAIRWCEAMARGGRLNSERETAKATLINRLGARLEARARRGEVGAAADDARFRLRVEGDSRSALPAARDLWSVRREPADARLVLETAEAAGDAGLARAVRGWARTNELHDVRLGPRRNGESGTP